ncbi:hypothetical protein NDA15_005995 [Ustilago hordei]|nr:hypothetical protein NDA15_005995 [Ustilago hordei]
MAIPPADTPAHPKMTAPNSSSVDSLDNVAPHSSTVAPVPHARRKGHPAGTSSTRVLQNYYPPKQLDLDPQSGQSTPFIPSGLAARAPIVIRPSGRPGFNAPRAATFFLGKDHERWRQYDLERFSGLFGWERIASAISSRSGHRGSRGAFSSYSSGSDDEHSDSGTSYRSSRYSGGSRSRRPSEVITPPMTPFDSTDPTTRPRRFSTNGPEAAFLRHETVIGIHTPRRRSSASSDTLPFLRPLAQIRPPSGQASAVDVPEPGSKAGSSEATAAETQNQPKKVKHSTEDRTSKKKDKKPSSKSHPTRSRTKEAPKPNFKPHGMLDLDDAARPRLRRLRSNLEQAAAAAAASTEPTPVEEDGEAEEVLEDAVGLQASLSDAALEGKGPLSAQDLRALLPATPRSPFPRSASKDAPPLKLAKRQQPQTVEGTLYDKTGPYREGAVTDGLSVRLFSAIQEPRTSSFEDADLSNSEHPVTKSWGRRGSSSSFDHGDPDDDTIYMSTARRRSNSSGMERRSSPRSSFSENDPTFTTEPESAVDDSNQVYLITTPDNRVSSAAKLRRWAMDTAGNFYAAMEIKSIEAKLRAADPSAGRVTRELAKELEETYLDDILDEAQKAQTLNPTRSEAVAKILKTEDDRYIRLEEDYPEEAFFVIAGCEESELNGVILNIFTQAIRSLARFHKSGWMHGDVKLENLMFDENGALVVIDYENANPYRGIPGGGWTGAVGEAYALRDGIEDVLVREVLLGKGQKKFLERMAKSITKKEREGADKPGDDYFAPKSVSAARKKIAACHNLNNGQCPDLRLPTTATGLPPARVLTQVAPSVRAMLQLRLRKVLLVLHLVKFRRKLLIPPTNPSPLTATVNGMDTPLPTPARLLYRFAHSAPELLVWVLTRCIVEAVQQRNIAEAEQEGLQLADWVEKEKGEVLDLGRKAVDAAIEMSGSVWVRPRLDEARKSLGLE